MSDPLVWYLVPELERDETFVSWFTRMAHNYGLTAAELYRTLLPGARIHGRDLDRFACDELLEQVADRTGSDKTDLALRTFHGWTGSLFEVDRGRGKLPWLPTSGTGQAGSSFGQQISPARLSEDTEPYMRRQWRLGFVTACPRHGHYLIDRCPSCRAPVQPQYQPLAYAESIAACWLCGFNLRRVVPEHGVDRHDIERQNELVEIAEEGWAWLGEYGAQYALAYFRVLWRIFRFLAAGRFSRALRAWIVHEAGLDKSGFEVPAHEVVERLGPRSRQKVLRLSMELIYDWPHRFVRACREVGISRRWICPEGPAAPFALWDPALRYLGDANRPLDEHEVAAAANLLVNMGYRPSYTNFRDLLGLRPQGRAAAMLKREQQRHMRPNARFWKLDGVDPAVRESARRAARKSGERLGTWVEAAVREKLERQTHQP